MKAVIIKINVFILSCYVLELQHYVFFLIIWKLPASPNISLLYGNYFSGPSAAQRTEIGFGFIVTSKAALDKAKGAVLSLLKQYDLNSDNVRIGFTSSKKSSSQSIVQMKKADVIQLIRSIEFKGIDQDLLSKKVEYSKNQLFEDCSEKEPCLEGKKVFMVLTDEIPDDDTKTFLRDLDNMNIKVLYTYISSTDIKPSDFGFADDDKVLVTSFPGKENVDERINSIVDLIDSGQLYFFTFSYFILLQWKMNGQRVKLLLSFTHKSCI